MTTENTNSRAVPDDKRAEMFTELMNNPDVTSITIIKNQPENTPA